jgi:hypothetical protein
MALSRGARLWLALLACIATVWVATVVAVLPASNPGARENDGDAAAISGPQIAWRGKAPWQIGRPSAFATITEAYTERPSYLPGETLRVAVSTTAKTFDVSIWRLGKEPVLMTQSRPISGAKQGGPIVDASTGMVRAGWRSRFGFRLPDTWTSGIYLVRVHGIGGADAYATFVLRSTRASDLLFVVNTLTDAAYNTWGGSSLYKLSIPGVRLPVPHAVAVSLDRPSNLADGAGTTFTQQWPLARWLERSGYDVTYTTDWDLSRDPDATPLPRAAVFGGHNEYWSDAMRAWFDRHIVEQPDMGLALFGANTGYWRVSISADGRTITCYKQAIAIPLASGASPLADQTRELRFRDGDLAGSPGSRHPEQLLFGSQYGSITDDITPFVVQSTIPAALLEGTLLTPGDSLGRIVGGETDAVDPSVPVPQRQSVIAMSWFKDIYGAATSAAAVYRPLPGNRAVFSAGTFLWMWGLDQGYAKANGVPYGFAALTRNILAGVQGLPLSAPEAPAPVEVSPSASAPAG